MKKNNGTLIYNFDIGGKGVVETNDGTVSYNFGIVEKNNGEVTNNFGTIKGGTSAINNYYKLDHDRTKVTVSDCYVMNLEFYVLSTASVTLTPVSGQHFTNVAITPQGGANLTKNDDGTYTLSGITQDIKLIVTTAAHSGGTATCEDKAVCTICGKEYGELAAHTGGTATCKDRAVCTACGQEYGELSGDHTGGTATCEDKAVCSVCGEEYGELLDHTYGTDWKSDGTNHWRECTCGAKTEKQHTTAALLPAKIKQYAPLAELFTASLHLIPTRTVSAPSARQQIQIISHLQMITLQPVITVMWLCG